jgi:hypothetical protein
MFFLSRKQLTVGSNKGDIFMAQMQLYTVFTAVSETYRDYTNRLWTDENEYNSAKPPYKNVTTFFTEQQLFLKKISLSA